jgi:hypothetical protein
LDLLSHGLVGALFERAAPARSWKRRSLVIAFAMLPDLPVFGVYLLLGREKGRPFWIPHNADWSGVRGAHPWWSALWEIPHSLFFVALILTPVVLKLRLPKVAIAAWLSHILLDIPTHTGSGA